MIGAREIARGERILQVVYGTRDADYPAQLRDMQVDREAFDRFLEARKQTINKHYRQAASRMDPRLHAAYNTLLMHFFLVGIVCGRDEKARIE